MTILPTVAQMQQMGLVECGEPGCTIYVDPANMPARRCKQHGGLKRPRTDRYPTGRPSARRREDPVRQMADTVREHLHDPAGARR